MPAWSPITTKNVVFSLLLICLFNFNISELQHFDKEVLGFKV